MESTDHVTATFVVPSTVAVNGVDAPVVILVELGETDTVTFGSETETCALDVFVVSATLVAVTV
jgi:hypothetical protein